MVFKPLIDSLSRICTRTAQDQAMAMDIVDRNGRHHQPKAIPEGGQYEEEGQYLTGNAKLEHAMREAGRGKHGTLLREHVAPLYAKLGVDSATRAKIQKMHEDIRGLSKGALMRGMVRYRKEMQRHADNYNAVKDMNKEEFRSWLNEHPEYRIGMVDKLMNEGQYNGHRSVKGGYHDDGTGHQKHEAWEEAKWSVGARAMAAMMVFQEHADALNGAPDQIMANMIEHAANEQGNEVEGGENAPQVGAAPQEQITTTTNGTANITPEESRSIDRSIGEFGESTSNALRNAGISRTDIIDAVARSSDAAGRGQFADDVSEALCAALVGGGVSGAHDQATVSQLRNSLPPDHPILRAFNNTGTEGNAGNATNSVRNTIENAVRSERIIGRRRPEVTPFRNGSFGVSGIELCDENINSISEILGDGYDVRYGLLNVSQHGGITTSVNGIIVSPRSSESRQQSQNANATEASSENVAEQTGALSQNGDLHSFGTYTDREGNTHQIQHNEGGLKAPIHQSEIGAVQAEMRQAFEDARNDVDGAEEYAHALSHFLGRGNDARSPHPGMRQEGLLKHQLADKMKTRLEAKRQALDNALANGTQDEVREAQADYGATQRAIRTIADRCGITADMLPEGGDYSAIKDVIGGGNAPASQQATTQSAAPRMANPDHQPLADALHSIANPQPQSEVTSQSVPEPTEETRNAMRRIIENLGRAYGGEYSPEMMLESFTGNIADGNINLIRNGFSNSFGMVEASPALADHLEAIRRLPREQQLAHVQRLMGVEPTSSANQQQATTQPHTTTSRTENSGSYLTRNPSSELIADARSRLEEQLSGPYGPSFRMGLNALAGHPEPNDPHTPEERAAYLASYLGWSHPLIQHFVQNHYEQDGYAARVRSMHPEVSASNAPNDLQTSRDRFQTEVNNATGQTAESLRQTRSDNESAARTATPEGRVNGGHIHDAIAARYRIQDQATQLHVQAVEARRNGNTEEADRLENQSVLLQNQAMALSHFASRTTGGMSNRDENGNFTHTNQSIADRMSAYLGAAWERAVRRHGDEGAENSRGVIGAQNAIRMMGGILGFSPEFHEGQVTFHWNGGNGGAQGAQSTAAQHPAAQTDRPIEDHVQTLAEQLQQEFYRRHPQGETGATVEGIRSALTQALSNPNNQYARALTGENMGPEWSGVTEAMNALGDNPAANAIIQEIRRRRGDTNAATEPQTGANTPAATPAATTAAPAATNTPREPNEQEIGTAASRLMTAFGMTQEHATNTIRDILNNARNGAVDATAISTAENMFGADHPVTQYLRNAANNGTNQQTTTQRTRRGNRTSRTANAGSHSTRGNRHGDGTVETAKAMDQELAHSTGTLNFTDTPATSVTIGHIGQGKNCYRCSNLGIAKERGINGGRTPTNSSPVRNELAPDFIGRDGNQVSGVMSGSQSTDWFAHQQNKFAESYRKVDSPQEAFDLVSAKPGAIVKLWSGGHSTYIVNRGGQVHHVDMYHGSDRIISGWHRIADYHAATSYGREFVDANVAADTFRRFLDGDRNAGTTRGGDGEEYNPHTIGKYKMRVAQRKAEAEGRQFDRDAFIADYAKMYVNSQGSYYIDPADPLIPEILADIA